MLAVFYGNDVVAVRDAAHAYVLKHANESAVTTIDADTYVTGTLRDAAGGVSLFGGTSVYVIDTPSAAVDFEAEVHDTLPALAASAHQFIVIEQALLADEKKAYAKHADTIEEFKRPAERGFNTFALADALARKDKRTLWLLLHDAFRAGEGSEEIIGILWWQLKALRLASLTATAKEADMKEFPYNKAKRALSKFEAGELTALSHSLLAAYHDARRGALDLDLALERWVLTL